MGKVVDLYYFLIKPLLLKKLKILNEVQKMTDLTLKQRFGSNAEFDEMAETLTIKLTDLSDKDDLNIGDMTNGRGLDVSGMTDANKDEYSSRILWALLQLNQQNQPEDDDDETVGVYVTNEGRRNFTRNSVAQVGFRLTTTAYIDDPLGVDLDPDEIGTSA